MAKFIARAKRDKERGMALLLSLFALLLLSALGLGLVLASNTETRINANYSGGLSSYYAARSGLEEIRDRMKYPSDPANPAKSGLSDLLPTDIAGNAGGVLYILNPANGEVVDPTDPTSPYFDDQLCHDYNSGVATPDAKCTALPANPGWRKAWQTAAPVQPGAVPLGYKWARITLKTNRIAAPYYVDGAGNNLDMKVCWDGETEQLSPGATAPCDANGMQQVYMLTSLAATAQSGGPNGSRKLLRLEVVAPSIRPPGAVTLETSGTTNPATVTATFNNVVIPATSVDGRVHAIDGSLAGAPACSPVTALAADSPQGTAALQSSLNDLRRTIVQTANNSCKADGTSTVGYNCTPPLAWVRGTNANPQFTTVGTLPGPTPTPTPVPTPTPTPSPTPVGGGGHDGHGSDDHLPFSTPTPTPIPTPTPAPTPTPSNPNDCDVSSPNCYKNLDLSAIQLNPASLFAGAAGNSGDPDAYQAQSSNIVVNENKAVADYILSRKTSNTNYFELTSASLDPTVAYGTPSQPVVLVITDTSLKLNNALSGVGILVVPNDFEINAALNWSGIVVVQPALGMTTGQFLINSGASGAINGAVMLQAGTQLTLTTNTVPATPGTPSNPFKIAYSCDAIDAAMGKGPLKVVAHSERSY